MGLLEEVWEFREQTLFPSLFGQAAEEIYVLDAGLFASFGVNEVDPRWLFLGVMAFPPTPTRASWLYVTSGGTTPWDVEDDDGVDLDQPSWLGTELVIEAPGQATWPIEALRRLLAYNVLLAHGHFGDVAPLRVGARVPLGGPIAPGVESSLRYVVIARPAHYAADARLASGTLEFLHVVGVSESERDYAKSHSTLALLDRLESAGAFPVTDPCRQVIV